MTRMHAGRGDFATDLKRAQTLLAGGKAREAADLFARVVETAPRTLAAWAGLGMARHETGDLKAAEQAFARTVEIEPRLGSAHVVLGSVRRQLGRLDEAQAALEAALALDARNAGALANLGLVQIDQGHPGAARETLRTALKLAPENVHALVALASLDMATAGDPIFATLEGLAESEKISREDHVQIHYTLGKLYADAGDYGASLRNYRKANDLQRIEDIFHDRAFDRTAWTARVDGLLAAEASVADRPDPSSPIPVFLLGLPRSGKTLLETSLARHPDCTALGESDIFVRGAVNLGWRPAMADEFDPLEIEDWGRNLLASLPEASPGRRLLTTLPEHAWYLPLLMRAFPGARYVFCGRDPVDLGLSIHFKDLRRTHNYANDFASLGHAFRESTRLEAHFRESLGEDAIGHAYEDLVADPESALRRILDFLDLPFHPDCLPDDGGADRVANIGPARSVRGVTAIHDGFVGLWESYRDDVRDLMVQVGKDDRARRVCREALAADPDDARARADLGRALAAAGETGEGLAECRRAVTARDDDPRIHAAHAAALLSAGDPAGAVDAYWAALSIRPYDTGAPGLHLEMLDALETVDPGLADLHRDIAALFRLDRQAFGDFGLLYQACEPLKLPGHRPSSERYGVYGLDDLLTPESRVLDIGCNAGFLSLLCARTAASVEGFDIEPRLVEIGRRAARHMGLENVRLDTRRFQDFAPDRTYDLIFAFAVHHWIDLPFDDFADRLAGLIAPGGALVFESQGRRSAETLEEDLPLKMGQLAERGLRKLRDGEMVDDGVNRRYWAVLRRED